MANEDMSNIINQLSGMLKDNDTIPDNIKDMLNHMKSNDSNSNSTSSTSSDSSINTEMLNNFMNMLSHSNHDENNNNSNEQSKSSSPSIDFEMMMKMKTMIDKMNNSKDDPRANLLNSLKPYLKDSRKEKVDQYVKLFNMSKVIEVFNSSGGDKEK